MAERKLMSGNEAVARGAWEAGVHVATAYPGTPATEINEYLATYPEIKTEWSVNEKVAMEVAIGASIAGGRALVSMKQVGINVAADPLFSFAYAGVNGGMVIITADEPGLHSSQNEQDNRYYAKFAEIPMLEPSDAQEAKDMVKAAFGISEQYDIPVFVRMTTRLCHTSCVVTLAERREVPRKPYLRNPGKNTMIPSHAYQRHFDLEKRQILLQALANTSEHNRMEMRSLEYGVVTSGISYQNVREALPDYSVLKIGMTYPIPEQAIRNFASQVDYLYVAEENRPFLEEAIKALGIKVDGKEQLLRVGELSADELRRRILRRRSAQKGVAEAVPPRPPQFCPGCGHRGVFYLLAKHKIIVSGDIGCYGLAALPPYNAMDVLICMGASVGMAHGFDKVREPKERVVAVIGDSTFAHSGMTALANSVHNRGASTILVLDNRITAMTGHQPNPTSGFAIDRVESPRLDLVEVCRALGVKHVTEADGYDLKALEKLILAEIERPEVSVIVIREKCIITDRKPHAPPFAVNDACVTCKTCFKLGCPAITIADAKVVILDYLCHGCGFCAAICPKHAIVPTTKE
jgi:indolepyruvate ferredoxin oxidoreductase alpha subunit